MKIDFKDDDIMVKDKTCYYLIKQDLKDKRFYIYQKFNDDDILYYICSYDLIKNALLHVKSYIKEEE